MRVVTFDFETTNLDKGDPLNKDNRIVLASWWCSWDNRIRTTVGSEYEQGHLFAAIKSADLLVAFNAKFELQWLARAGVDVQHIAIFDPMLAEYVLAGNRRWKLSLDETALRYNLGGKVSLVSTLIKGGVCPSDIPTSVLREYCEKDVELTRYLWERQVPLLEAAQLTHIAENRFNTCRVLADIEAQGVQLDVEATEAEYSKTSAEHARLQAALDAMSGGLNWDSPKQIGEYLYTTLGFAERLGRDGEPDRTDAGGRRTDESTVLSLKPCNRLQREFLALYTAFVPLKLRDRQLRKLRDAGLEGGRLYATLNQGIAQTHRLTSTGKKFKVQFQNFDRDFKRLIVPSSPEFYIMEADAMQLEFRVAGHMGRDKQVLSDVIQKEDIHRYTASIIYDIPITEVTNDKRTDAKPYTFKPLYGGNSGTEREVAYYEAFRRKYKETYQTQKKWTYEVLANGKLTTEYGMIFYWPDTVISERGYIKNTPSIFNYPVQGFATAEIIPIALYCLWRRLKRNHLLSKIINTVHDSVVLEVHEDEVDEVKEMVKLAFTHDVFHYLNKYYKIKFTIPLGVEIKVGTFWGDGSLSSTKHEVTPEEALG